MLSRYEGTPPWSLAKTKMEELISRNKSFALAILDIDRLTWAHDAYGREYRLAGKVRLLIDEAIENVLRDSDFKPYLKVEQYRSTGADESAAYPRGQNTQQE